MQNRSINRYRVTPGDGICAIATQVGLELSEICKGSPTRTIKLIPRVSLIELPMGCSASRISIFLPPHYQTKEKFEEKKPLVTLIDRNSSNWVELWEPIIKKFPLKRTPEWLKPFEKINIGQLKERLNAIKEANSVWKNNPGTMINWSTMQGIIIVITVGISALWGLKRCRWKWLIKQNVPARLLVRRKRRTMRCFWPKQVEFDWTGCYIIKEWVFFILIIFR